MQAIGKLIFIATIITGLLNGIIFLGTVIELLDIWIGSLAYVLWFFVAPIFSPAMIVLPWFDAWVNGGQVNENILIIWISFYVCLLLRFITWKWAPDN